MVLVMHPPKRIWAATPYGEQGMGGIDRLNDAIVDAFAARPELGLQCTRLVTRGKWGLLRAQGVFASALARFSIGALRGEIDLLHIHLSNGGSGYRKSVLGKLARALRIPYVLHLHGIQFREFWATTNPVLQKELVRLHEGSARIIVLGQYWAGVILERVPAVADRIVVLPNATAAIAATPCPAQERHEVRITFLGRLGARKGVPDLLRALGTLKKIPDWSATVAGDGEIEETRAQAQRQGLSDRVSIPGWLDVAARTRLLEQTDILVLPSHAENLPMVIIEAFAYGIAVVSTPVGAIPEAVTSGHNGILVPPGDDRALACALERLIADQTLRRSLGEAARATHRERYEFDRYVGRLAEIWRQAAL